MSFLQERTSAITDATLTRTGERTPWRARRHIKVRLYDGGFLLERCEEEPCLVSESGLASCGRLACPSCGRGSGNLSSWQLAGLPAGEPVACNCGYLWVPRPLEDAPATSTRGRATSNGARR
jgi:hypothetical protein